MKRRRSHHEPSDFRILAARREVAQKWADRDEEPFVLVREGHVIEVIAQRKAESFLAAHPQARLLDGEVLYPQPRQVTA